MPISPPTISTFIYPNNPPFTGKEGNKLTSQVIWDGLYKEAETNITPRVLPGPTTESFELCRGGILPLGVLFEQMRGEGFEFAIGPPKAVLTLSLLRKDGASTRGPGKGYL
ncbi:hypothetical protein D9758_005271 [Tetrapyrgos nigripes]|uniref:Uncharacterized protein n=1 Tax=Tetrapyrgos nigripes TaxID=182062 RepID=A0A8H5GXB3_9AGAR|nr:hypothetical protein D9758_005271 [Tetrapyrgos nigripes]